MRVGHFPLSDTTGMKGCFCPNAQCGLAGRRAATSRYWESKSNWFAILGIRPAELIPFPAPKNGTTCVLPQTDPTGERRAGAQVEPAHLRAVPKHLHQRTALCARRQSAI